MSKSNTKSRNSNVSTKADKSKADRISEHELAALKKLYWKRQRAQAELNKVTADYQLKLADVCEDYNTTPEKVDLDKGEIKR